jgi:hypothetical protein
VIFDRSAGLLDSITLLLRDPQISLLLARCCVLPTVTHLLRSALPGEVAPFCRPFDSAMLRCFERVVQLADPLPAVAAAILQLRLRHGGFGFTRTDTTRPIAFMSGALGALDALCDIDATWQAAVEGFVAGMPEGDGPLAPGESIYSLALRTTHAQVLTLIPPVRRATAGYQDGLVPNLAAGAHLQRRLGREHAAHQRDVMADALLLWSRPGPGRSVAQAEEARWRLEGWEAARSRAASSYLAVMPDARIIADEIEGVEGGFFAMDAPLFRITVCIHLRLPFALVPTAPPLMCPCPVLYAGDGEPPAPHALDPFLSVASSCMGSFGVAATSATARHNLWARDWLTFLRAMGVMHAAEPRGLDAGCRRPDALVVEPGEAALRLCDVAIACPVSPCRRRDGFPGGVGGAVAMAEQGKVAIYARSPGWAAVRPLPVTVPLVGSTLGRIGPAAWRFFDRVYRSAVADRLVLNRQHLPQHMLREYWQRRLSVGLRQCVAVVIYRRLQAARAGVGGLPEQPGYFRGSSLSAVRRMPAIAEALSRDSCASGAEMECAADDGDFVVGTGFLAPG